MPALHDASLAQWLAVGVHHGEQAEWHAPYRVTSDIVRRACEHRQAAMPGFTKRHDLKRLVMLSGTTQSRPQSSERKHEALAARMEAPRHSCRQSGLAGFVQATWLD